MPRPKKCRRVCDYPPFPVFLPSEGGQETEEERDGIWKLSLSGTTKEDIREIVSLTLAKQNMIILEMQVESQSLEEIFIELTDQSEEDEA